MWPSDLFKANHRGPDVKISKNKRKFKYGEGSQAKFVEVAGKGGEFLGEWDLRYEVGCVRTKVESHQEEDAHTCTPLTVLILNAFSVNPKLVFLFLKKKKKPTT